MAFPKFKIADDDGNVADVQSNRLDLNTSHPSGLGTINSLARVNVPQTGAEALSVTCSIAETSAKEIIIQAANANDDSFVVGDSGATHESNGIVMQPGDTLILPIADISTIYWDAPASVQRAFVTIIK